MLVGQSQVSICDCVLAPVEACELMFSPSSQPIPHPSEKGGETGWLDRLTIAVIISAYRLILYTMYTTVVSVDKTLQSYIVLAGYSAYISLCASTSETLLTVLWSWYW